MNSITWVGVLLGAMGGLVVGALLATWRMQRQTTGGLRVPAQWPLTARGLVTSGEDEVWKWLRRIFHDHLVMIKVPVLRFTIPIDKEKHKSAQWLEMLNGVYTTFTVCTLDGAVVGCVDVPGKRGLGQANRELKEELLSDCKISYTVVRSNSLPSAQAMRAAFLGETVEEYQTQPQPLDAQDSSFQAEVAAFTVDKTRSAKEAAQREINRQARESSPKSRTPAVSGQSAASRRFPTEWEDSFIQPADTRPAKLD